MKFCWKSWYVQEGRASSKWKGAAVFADGLRAAVDSGVGSISDIFGSNTI